MTGPSTSDLLDQTAGEPATALPVRVSRSGLPRGAQVIGGWMQDLTTLHFAGLLEREFGGFVPPPARPAE